MDSTSISDKVQMLNCFNKHFVASGFLFELQNLACCDSDFTNAESRLKKYEFRFKQIKNSDVYKALKLLNTNKSPGPDCVESVYLKSAAEFIASPLTYIFTLSLNTGVITEIWKSAFVVPLLKRGDSTILDNYRPISKLCFLSKILKSLISEQLTCYLNVNKVFPFMGTRTASPRGRYGERLQRDSCLKIHM